MLNLLTNIALKEWAVAVEALSAGETILLLRKGGIKETDKSFQLKHSQFVLYPTYEHQKPHLLKPAYASKVTQVPPLWHPETQQIKCFAEVTNSFQVSDRHLVEQLLPYHIWNETFIVERLCWKPTQPLNLLVLRVYSFPNPVTLSYSPVYGGCKSWIQLNQSFSLDKSYPALSDCEYQAKVEHICSIINQQ